MSAPDRTALDALAAHPLVAALAPAERAALLANVAVEAIDDGCWVLRAGDPLDVFPVLVEGELDLVQDGRLVGLAEAPRALEIAAALRGGPAVAGYRAAGPVRVARLPASLLHPSAAVVGELVAEIDALTAARQAAAVAADDFFEQPGARLVPGPYRFGPFDAHPIVAEAEPAALAALLPPGLRPLPGSRGRYLVTFTAIEGARVDHGRDRPAYRYHETTPFIPCLGPRGTGLYTPELYPDSIMAILLGREIYGFPKRLGRTFPRADGADVVVDHARLLRARWSGRRALAPSELVERLGKELVPGLFALPGAGRVSRAVVDAVGSSSRALPSALRTASVFVRKRILSEASSVAPRYRVDELVEVPFVVESLTDAATWDRHDVRFAGASPVLPGRAVAVFSARLAFRFGAGVRRRDYLARGEARREPRRAGEVVG